MAIQISVNGLVKFMQASSVAQRTLLRDHKFPFDANGKKRPQIVHYSEASAAVLKYHEAGNKQSILDSAVESLLRKIQDNPELNASRIEDNVRAIRAYSEHFSTSRYLVLPNPKPKYSHGDVTVSATTDLYVSEAGTNKLIRLDFKAAEAEKDIIQTILKITHAAALMSGLDIDAGNVVYIDVCRKKMHKGKEMNKRLKAEVEAACDTIAAIWPTLKR
jgi:hypothetical protein